MHHKEAGPAAGGKRKIVLLFKQSVTQEKSLDRTTVRKDRTATDRTATDRTGYMTLWSATSNLLVWSLISFSLYSYYEYHRIVNCSWYCQSCLVFYSRWQSGEVQETSGGALWPHDRGIPTVLPGHHTSIHLIQPPAPERAVVNIFIAWWGTLGGWDMLLLLCAFSVWCSLLGACTSVTHCFTPVNVCAVDDKLHSQAVCKVHGAYSTAGPQTDSENCFQRKGKLFARPVFDHYHRSLSLLLILLILQMMRPDYRGTPCHV